MSRVVMHRKRGPRPWLSRVVVRMLRTFVAIWLVGGLLAPTHFVAAVSHAICEDTVDVTQCPDDDDQCPPNCSACPCGEVPCIPAPVQAALADVVWHHALDASPPSTLLHDRLAQHRLDRPPRA